MGGFDFREVGCHLAAIATEKGGLRPEQRILDIGCGVGRLAAALTGYLTNGEYVGFDVSRRAIRWSQKNISARHPQFFFRYVDVLNSHYNPRGKISPEKFSFPCEDSSIDLAFASSVFTHLSPAATQRYLAEAARVLRPGGRAVLSFYLLDPEVRRRLGSLWPRFQHSIEGSCVVANARAPEEAVAYDLEVVRSALDRSGFREVEVARGEWVTGPPALSYQDFVFAVRGP